MSKFILEKLRGLARGQLINMCVTEQLFDDASEASKYSTTDLIDLLSGESAGDIERIQE